MVWVCPIPMPYHQVTLFYGIATYLAKIHTFTIESCMGMVWCTTYSWISFDTGPILWDCCVVNKVPYHFHTSCQKIWKCYGSYFTNYGKSMGKYSHVPIHHPYLSSQIPTIEEPLWFPYAWAVVPCPKIDIGTCKKIVFTLVPPTMSKVHCTQAPCPGTKCAWTQSLGVTTFALKCL